jgi:hypothetical protein
LPDAAGWAVRLVAACLALAALSLLLPWALAFDPWSWVVWGREVTRLELDTAGGPSWKPLPVVATTPLALTGAAAPAAWLVLARAGGLLAVAAAAVLAGRLAGAIAPAAAGGTDPAASGTAAGGHRAASGTAAGGHRAASGTATGAHRAAAVAAALTVGLSSWWFFNTTLGNSEGLLAAAVLWAVVAHLAGRTRAALALALAAALLRPEVWPFLGIYALWLWRTGRESLGVLALALLPVPLLWFGPDAIGVGGALGASDAARGTASPQSAVNADFPALEVLLDFADLVTLPVLAMAVAGAALGGRTARLLASGALAWVALVAVMTQAGYAGNPRYNVAPAAVACVLAGIGVAAVARRPFPAAVLATALVASTLAFTAGDLADQFDELGARADRREQLDALVDSAAVPCEPVFTNQPMKAMVAWRLDVSMEHLANPPRPPGAVFRAPPGYDGGPPLPLAPGFEKIAREGDWTLAAACPT